MIWSLLIVALFVPLDPVNGGKVSCSVLSGKSATADYGLSDEAAAGIKDRQGNAQTGSIQVLDCSCPSDNDDLQDSDVNTFNQDTNLYEENTVDWKNSGLFRVSSCKKLALNLKNNNNGFAHIMGGSAFLVENVEQLDLISFDAGKKKTGTAATADSAAIDSSAFTSLTFRNLTFSNTPPNPILFEEKIEVLFDGITVSESEPFNVEVTNKLNTRDPIVRVVKSTFAGQAAATSGITNNANKFKLKVKNQQKAVDSAATNNEACNLDSKGQIIIANNTIGVIDGNGLDVQYAGSMKVEDNFVHLAEEGAFNLDGVKTLSMKRNRFSYVLKQPVLALTYVKRETPNSCSQDDLPASAVGTLAVEGNHFAHLQQSPITTDIQGYASPNDILNKLSTTNNTAQSPCECDDPTADDDSTEDDDLFLKIVQNSHCFSTNSGMPLTGVRDDICSGRHPKTDEEKEADIREDEKGRWIMYLIIVGIASALLAALVTALLMKFCRCCMGDEEESEVSPRDYRGRGRP